MNIITELSKEQKLSVLETLLADYTKANASAADEAAKTNAQSAFISRVGAITDAQCEAAEIYIASTNGVIKSINLAINDVNSGKL